MTWLCRDSYPMILVANKVDLVHLRKVSEEQGRDLATHLKVGLIPACDTTGFNQLYY